MSIKNRFFYHGSPCRIDSFSYEFIGHGKDQYGSGFYFTSCRTSASGYAVRNEVSDRLFKGNATPTLHKVKLSIENPLDTKHKQSLSSAQVRTIIERAPSLLDRLSESYDVEYEGYENVLRKVIEIYSDNDESTLLEQLNMLSNDFYGLDIKEFNECIRDVLGYDSVVDHYGKEIIVAAWFPEQIQIVSKMRKEPENDFSL